MCTITTTSRAKQAPTTSIDHISADGTSVTIRKGRTIETYDVAEFPARGGRLFSFAKAAGETYQVYASENGQDHSCDCKGHQFTGHCKHVDAIYHLWAAGWLPTPASETPDFPVQSDSTPCDECGAPVDDPFETLCETCQTLIARESNYRRMACVAV